MYEWRLTLLFYVAQDCVYMAGECGSSGQRLTLPSHKAELTTTAGNPATGTLDGKMQLDTLSNAALCS